MISINNITNQQLCSLNQCLQLLYSLKENASSPKGLQTSSFEI